MSGGKRDPMEGAGWGGQQRREDRSERDPAFRADRRRGEARMPLGALLIAAVGIVAGLVGSLAAPGSPRFDLTVAEGFARAGFAIAILAGLWISFGSRNRAAGAQLIGVTIVAISVIATILTS